jgi:hypothetical protein
MSSRNYKKTWKLTGIFDKNPDVNPLNDANKAFLPYCTSDAHMGNIGPTK